MGDLLSNLHCPQGDQQLVFVIDFMCMASHDTIAVLRAIVLHP